MSNTVDKNRLTSHTPSTSHTSSTSHTPSTSHTSSTSHTPSTHGAHSAERDRLEAASRGRQWFEETHGTHVHATPHTVPNNPDIEPIRAGDLQDWRRRA